MTFSSFLVYFLLSVCYKISILNLVFFVKCSILLNKLSIYLFILLAENKLKHLTFEIFKVTFFKLKVNL